jgi:hypothetical protein
VTVFAIRATGAVTAPAAHLGSRALNGERASGTVTLLTDADADAVIAAAPAPDRRDGSFAPSRLVAPAGRARVTRG